MTVNRSTQTDDDLIRFISYRYDVLEALEEQDLNKRDLSTEISVSKSTVYKAVNRFQEAGLVSRRANGLYSLTLLGELLLDQYREAKCTIEGNVLLDCLPEETPLSPELLKGGDFWVNSPESPYAPLTKLEELFETTTNLRIICGHPSYRTLRLLRGPSEDCFDTLECIMCRSHVDHLRESQPDALRENVERPNQTYYEADEVYDDIGIGLSDVAIYITCYNDYGHIQGLIENRSPTAIEWGSDTFTQSKRDASRISADSL